MTQLGKKLVFITGGSSGIGLETGRLLSSKGGDLVLFARGKRMLDDAVREVQRHAAVPSQRVGAISLVVI